MRLKPSTKSRTAPLLARRGPESPAATMPTDLDVLVVGAGLSGVNAAYHLANSPLAPRFAVVDTHESFGGT
ncbi:MAG: FAD-binding protein, partial [Betaproteobacteria bacterium]|nr:FAD-binding protein [Betaproteobacteria bacterium]